MKRIKLFFYKSEPNFGDELNVYLLQRLFGIDAMYANKKHCDYVCIGSLLQAFITRPSIMRIIKKWIKPSVYVWGTGFIKKSPEYKHILMRKMKICALRGKLTLNQVKEYTRQNLDDVVLGDPGLLINRLIDKNKIQKIYKLGIIPHYVDKNNPLLKNINVENSIVIDIQTPVPVVLKQIAQCENIISSAMHGLIASDSLGIPNMRMVLSDKIIGGDYKFLDYYSALDIETPTPILITEWTRITNVDFIKQAYSVSPAKVEQICQKLLQAFPYKNRKKK